MIGILFESDEWSDWKLKRELEACLQVQADDAPYLDTRVTMINMEDSDCIEQALLCDMLISRIFASAAFRGHEHSHSSIQTLFALAEQKGIPIINSARAHSFEVDKRLSTQTMNDAGITTPPIMDFGEPKQLIPRIKTWSYPAIIKPNCGGRTTYTKVLHDEQEAHDFLIQAPHIAFIVEDFIESREGFLTRVEVIDGQLGFAVKRSVAPNGLSSYHEGSTFELYPDCPPEILQDLFRAADILDFTVGSFDVIEADTGNYVIDANSVSNVSEDYFEMLHYDLMKMYADLFAKKYKEFSKNNAKA